MARQNFIGLVISQGKMAKTVKVRVKRDLYDNVVHKEVQKIKDYLVHDELNICKEGDIVRIESCRPLSVKKSFAIAEIKKNQGQQFLVYQETAKERVAAEARAKAAEFFSKRTEFEELRQKIADLKLIGKSAIEPSTTPEKSKIIDDLKSKYGIDNWPYSQAQVALDVTKYQTRLKELLEATNRKIVVTEIMKDESLVTKILTHLQKGLDSKNAIKKNLVAKYVQENNFDSVEEVVATLS